MAWNASADFKAAYADGQAPMVKATLTLADGTVHDLTGADLALGGLSVTSATSRSGSFDIGAAVTGTCELTLANYDMRWDGTDFEGATVAPYAGADVGGSTEWLRLGTYVVHQPDTVGALVRLRCDDMMSRLSVPYSEVSTAYPATLGDIVADICTECGVTLDTPAFANYGYEVAARPDGDLACVDVVSFAAQASGNYAYMGQYGALRLGWYDLSAPVADVTALRSLTVGADPIEITGVRVTEQPVALADGSLPEEGATALSGVEGYVLSVSANPLVQAGEAATVAAMLAARAVGMAFSTMECDAIGMPWVVAGDAVTVTDRHARAYAACVTRATWRSTGSQSLACDAEAPERRGAASRTTAVGRAMTAVSRAVKAARSAASAAQAVADEAAAVAEAIGQHFFADTQGVHVTEAEGDPTTEHNILINSLGILLRHATDPLVSITQSAIAFYDGLGSAASNIVARFGADGSQVGRDGAAHTTVTDRAVSMVDANGGAYARMETTDPTTVRTFTFTGNGSTKAFTIASASQPTTDGKAPSCSVTVDGVPVTDGVKFRWTANYVSLVAVEVKVQGVTFDVAPANGAAIVLSVAWGHKRGFVFGVASNATGATGDCAVGEGYLPTASANASHAEGAQCVASGFAAHAEGHATLAEQPYSHAEGDGSEAVGESAHAEGYKCMAKEADAHAQNTMTVAGSPSQTAMGRYNVADYAGTYALIVGNGTSNNARSNALMVQWDGTIMNVSGNLTKDTAVGSNTMGKGIVFLDSALKAIGRVEPYFGTNNREGVRFGTSRTVNNTSVAHWMYIYINDEGDRTVSFSVPSAWRNGLGASGGVWPASIGGTGSDGFGEILTTDISTAVSVATATWKSLGSVELEAGDWIVSYNVQFDSNATGRRAMLLNTASGGAGSANLRQGGVQTMAVNGGGTYLNGCRVLHLTSSYTYYLNVYQTSGAALSTYGYIRAFRLR